MLACFGGARFLADIAGISVVSFQLGGNGANRFGVSTSPLCHFNIDLYICSRSPANQGCAQHNTERGAQAPSRAAGLAYCDTWHGYFSAIITLERLWWTLNCEQVYPPAPFFWRRIKEKTRSAGAQGRSIFVRIVRQTSNFLVATLQSTHRPANSRPRFVFVVFQDPNCLWCHGR